MRGTWQYLVVAFTAFLYEGAYTLWSWSVAHNQALLSVVCTFFLPFIQLLSVVFIIEAKSWRERLLVAWWTAVGYAAGTALILYWRQP